MKNKLTFFDYLLFTFALLMGATFVFLYPKIFPTAGIKLQFTADEALERASKIIQKFGYNFDGHTQKISFYRSG